MFDSRLNERIKKFQTTPHNILKKREEVSLSLRREQVFEHLMKKRLQNSSAIDQSNLVINAALLKINPIRKETFESTGIDDKLDYLTKWLIEEDASSKFNRMSDDRKFALLNLRLMTDQLEVEEDQDLDLDQHLINVLLYELFDSTEIIVKFEISKIFINLTSISNFITERLTDVDVFQKLYELTYSNCMPFIENIMLITANLIVDNPEESFSLMINNVPTIMRLKEMLQSNEFDKEDSVTNAIIYLLKSIIDTFKEDKKCLMFVDFIEIFPKYFENFNLGRNQETISNLLKILARLTRDEKNIGEQMISCKLVKYIVNIMSMKSLEQNLVYSCITIIGNLLCGNDKMADYVLGYNVLGIFDRLLNTYKNTVNNDDKYILQHIVWAVSNVTAGTEEQISLVVINSPIAKNILSINKFKHDNSLLSESLHIFFNALSKGSNGALLELMKMDTMRLICDGINRSDDVNILRISLGCVLKMIKSSRSILGTHMNIKNELISYNSLIKIEKLVNHKNEKISKMASQIISIMDLDKEYFDMMDCDL